MDSIYIEFHCLLSAQQWGFDDSSHVYMRFAALQNYDCCYGPMKIIRYVRVKLISDLYVCAYIYVSIYVPPTF